MANENRLIDANERIKWLEDNTTEEEWLVNQYNADWIYSMLEHAPTVDAVEVVHGRWLKATHSLSTGSILAGYSCSECDNFSVRNSNYCPNCGAKMDGE